MSYIVRIWQQPTGMPLPDDAPSIWQMLDGFGGHTPGQNSKFLELGRQLMALYPEPEDPNDDDVWLDGADGDTAELVWNLGLYCQNRLDEVQPMVAARAIALGLNLADEQANELYLADGRILAQRAGAHCMRAFAAYFSGDLIAAWNAFLPLAGQGNPTATHNLATMVLRGEAGRKNVVLGHALLMLAGDTTEAARLYGPLERETQAAADALLPRLKQRGQLVAIVQRLTALPPAAAPTLTLQQEAPPTAAPSLAPPPGGAVDIDALQQRATAGDREARFNLACQYKLGQGVPQSDAQALHWWQLAAEQGLADAQYNLALCYFLGDSVAKDETRAYKWFCQAVDGGHIEAIYNLGVMYQQGLAVVPDPIASKALYLHAKRLGSRHAKTPSYELGELSRVAALAIRMGETGKVLEALSAWRRSQARSAVAGGAANDPSGRNADPRLGLRSEPDSIPDTGWHLGHLALLIGALGPVLLILLASSESPRVLGKLLILIMELAAGYGVWRGARDLMLTSAATVLLVLLALVPGIGSFVCMGVSLKLFRHWRS